MNPYKFAAALTGRALSAAHKAGKPMSGADIARHKANARKRAAAASIKGSGPGAGNEHRGSKGNLRADITDAMDEAKGRY